MLNDTGFRSLASIADRVESRVDVYSTVVRQTASIAPDKRSAYLTEQVPELAYVDCADAPAPAHPSAAGAVSVARWSTPDGFNLLFRYHPEPAKSGPQADTCASTPVARLVASLAPDTTFDELMVADQDGAVLFSTDRTGMRVASLAHLFAESNSTAPSGASGQAPSQPETADSAQDPAPAAQPPPQPDPAFRARATASNVWPVQLAGAPYQAFLAPIPLRLARSDAVRTDSIGARFVLCGLMGQAAYKAAVTAVSGPAIILIGLVLCVIVIGSLPILKFTQMRATETIQRRTGLHYSVMTVWAMAFFVMLVIHAAYLLRESVLYTDTDARLVMLANAIAGNFKSEVQRSLAMLSAVEATGKFRNTPADRVKPDVACGSSAKAGAPSPSSWQGEALSIGLPVADYPYFDNLDWADQTGNQEIKWSVHKTPTPDKNLCEYQFFQGPLHGELWHFSGQGAGGPQFRVDPLLSPNTGQYIGMVGRAMPAPTGGRSLSVANVATPLLSLVNPILPPEYGFAVVDPSGLVLFHSQSQKDGNENLFHASQDNPALLSQIASRKPGALDITYLGVKHRAYVGPMTGMDDCPWTLVTFRDLTPGQSQHVERMTLFAILAILYLIAVALVGQSVPLPRYPPRWLWPAGGHVGRYRLLALALAAAIGVYYALTFVLTRHAIIAAAILVPLCALAVVFVCLRWKLEPGPPTESTFQPEHSLFGQTTSYSLVALGLLLIFGAVPCIGFYRLAYDYTEYEFARRALMSTATGVEQRACRVSSQYEDVRFSPADPAHPGSPANAETERTAREKFMQDRLQKETLDRYDAVFLSAAPATASSSHAAAAGSEPGLVKDVLDFITAHLPVWYEPPQQSSLDSANCPAAAWDLQSQSGARLRLKPNSAHDPHISRDLEADMDLDYLRPAPFFYAALLLITAGAFFLLRATIKRLFVTDFQPDPDWPEVRLDALPPLDRNLILIGVPFAGMTRAFLNLKEAHVVDLTQALPAAKADIGQISEGVVILDHFAFCCNDLAANRKKLDIIEQLVYFRGKRVVILTTIDPLFYLEAGTGLAAQPSLDALAPGEEMDRWNKALFNFETRRVADTPKEISPAYYRILWSTCTKRERVALYQLAYEGWANCQNQSALRHLFKRGLIEAKQQFRIRDERFCAFIRHSVGIEDRKTWERQDEISSWDGLKAALVVSVGLAGGAIALIYGQQAMGFVVAGVGALAPIVKTLTDLRGKDKPAAKTE